MRISGAELADMSDEQVRRLLDLATWRSLSKHQKAALDAAADAPLYKLRYGLWGHQSQGFGGHATGTINALIRRDLLAHRAPNCVCITKQGSDVFGSVGEKL